MTKVIHYHSVFPPPDWEDVEYNHIKNLMLFFYGKIMNHIQLSLVGDNLSAFIKYKNALKNIFHLIETQCLHVSKQQRPETIAAEAFHMYVHNKITGNEDVFIFDLNTWSLHTVPIFCLWNFIKNVAITGIERMIFVKNSDMPPRLVAKQKQVAILCNKISDTLTDFVKDEYNNRPRVLGHIKVQNRSEILQNKKVHRNKR